MTGFARGHLEGRVIRSTGSWYEVETAEGVISSKIRGKFRLQETNTTNPVAVGDHVLLRINEDDGTGYITEIRPRRNRLVRRAAGRRVGMEHVVVANVDAAWCIQSIRQPAVNTGFADRFIVMCELFHIPPGIVFNKSDLMTDEARDEVNSLEELYRELGYKVFRTSAKSGDGIGAFSSALQGKTNVVTGLSGVGKSTMLNTIDPSLDLRTGEVSVRTKKGRHTTASASLYALSGGGYVVDTPGMREFGVIELDPLEVGHYFVEFIPYLDECRFPNCTHDHEPGCAVMAAVDEGAVTETRYRSYLNILASVQAGEKDVGR